MPSLRVAALGQVSLLPVRQASLLPPVFQLELWGDNVRVDEKHLTIQGGEVLAALTEALNRRLGPQRYDLWFANKTKFTWQDSLLVIGVPNHFYQEWLDKKFSADVQAAAVAVLGFAPPLRFAIDADLFQAARRQEAASLGPKADSAGPAPSLTAAAMPTSQARPDAHQRQAKAERRQAGPVRRWRQLGDFVVGSCNRVAHASALSIIEAPNQGPNPLLLHGPVGTGKSHLLEGICTGLRQHHPASRIRFVTAEAFTNHFVQAMRLGKLTAFRKQHRDVDVLLLDDVHFLAGKPKTQEEFLHTLDALCREGRQVVLTSDTHPRLSDHFLPELTDRLVGGAVWGLTLPEEETRRQILQSKADQSGGPRWPKEVIEFIAGQLRGNVRELEGAVHTVTHVSRVTGRPIDLALVREALEDYLRHAVKPLALADVERALCQVLRLEAAVLHAAARDWRHSHPRMLAMYLARKHTGATYAEIGQRFGRRNHSTVVAAEKKVRLWLQTQATVVIGERQLGVREVLERVEQELLR